MTEPFLKWAGGKRWLVSTDSLPKPSSYRRYIEPFLGGGAIFFHLRPSEAILSDVNKELIHLYCTLRDFPARLMEEMKKHQQLHCTEHYYEVRARIPQDDVERAARTLYLNRTCWNGLYRVNLNGNFNVPQGTKSTVVFSTDDFEAISLRLRAAELRCCDFGVTVAEAGEGDFLFVDPPYTVKHNSNGFVKYNETLFTWADQVRLRNSVADAIVRGAAVVVTNADHESIRDLYLGICHYQSLARTSVLASEAVKRGRTSEALFVANLD